MLSSVRYDFLPFDVSYRLDNASSNYCGYISDITTGLVTVINAYTIRFASTYSVLSSRTTASCISSLITLPSPIINDVRLCAASLFGKHSLSITSDTSLVLDSILKFMHTDVSASLFPTYWSEQAILSVQSLSYLNYRYSTAVTSVGSFITAAVFDVTCGVGYSSSPLYLDINAFLGTRSVNYIGISIRQLLKTWLRWSDTSVLSGSWYSITLADMTIHSMIGVRQRVTDAVTWLSRVEATHNKVCYGAIVTVGDDVIRYTGLAYEVQALSVSLLVYVSAMWQSGASKL